MYDSHDLTWKSDKLFVVAKRAPVVAIVRDDRFPSMWRFRLLPDGELSDMVNISRVKDAASAHVATFLNRRERRAAGRPIEQTAIPVPTQPAKQTPLCEAAT